MSDHQIDAIAYTVKQLEKPRSKWWRFGRWLFTERFSFVELNIIFFIIAAFRESNLTKLFIILFIGSILTIWGTRHLHLKPPLRKSNVRSA